jgi:N-methylhydantoinase A
MNTGPIRSRMRYAKNPDNSMTQAGWRVGIDVGGTFTDIVAVSPDGRVASAKATTDTNDALAALGQCLSAIGLEWEAVGDLVHGTTRITNAIVEGHLARVTLIATEGFADVLAIGRQNRRDLYSLPAPPKATPLVPGERRLEVAERIGPDGAVQNPLQGAAIAQVLEAVAATKAEAVAVCLIHAYANADHEKALGAALKKEHGHIALSHAVSPEAREYERTATTVLSAALMPSAERYLHQLEDGLPDGINLHMVQSNGGMASTRAMASKPLGLAMSGPAAGVTAVAAVARDLGIDQALAFDMGGTTTDVSLVRDGAVTITTQRPIGDTPVRQPMVDVRSVGAGGGSIATVKAGGLTVGPASAGADPGPAAYGRGGTQATVTDANLALGYLADGAELGAGNVRLDRTAARSVVAAIAGELGVGADEAALGIHRIANAAMARAVATVTVERGIDARDATLVAYGGAGPIHAVHLARELDITRVVVPRLSSVFSALGCLAARPFYQQQTSLVMTSDAWNAATLDAVVAEQKAMLGASLLAAGHDATELVTEMVALVRYAGQSYAVEVPMTDTNDPDALGEAFLKRHTALYGYTTDEVWEIEALRVAIGLAGPAGALLQAPGSGAAQATSEEPCLFPGTRWVTTPRYQRGGLGEGASLAGPAIIEDAWSTIVLPPGAELVATAAGDLLIEVGP